MVGSMWFLGEMQRKARRRLRCPASKPKYYGPEDQRPALRYDRAPTFDMYSLDVLFAAIKAVFPMHHTLFDSIREAGEFDSNGMIVNRFLQEVVYMIHSSTDTEFPIWSKDDTEFWLKIQLRMEKALKDPRIRPVGRMSFKFNTQNSDPGPKDATQYAKIRLFSWIRNGSQKRSEGAMLTPDSTGQTASLEDSSDIEDQKSFSQYSSQSQPVELNSSKDTFYTDSNIYGRRAYRRANSFERTDEGDWLQDAATKHIVRSRKFSNSIGSSSAKHGKETLGGLTITLFPKYETTHKSTSYSGSKNRVTVRTRAVEHCRYSSSNREIRKREAYSDQTPMVSLRSHRGNRNTSMRKAYEVQSCHRQFSGSHAQLLSSLYGLDRETTRLNLEGNIASTRSAKPHYTPVTSVTENLNHALASSKRRTTKVEQTTPWSDNRGHTSGNVMYSKINSKASAPAGSGQRHQIYEDKSVVEGTIQIA